MRSFKKFVIESIEQAELDEAVEVRHDRYMRSHGKKASGGTGSWMFTHKAMGDVDHKNEKEVYSAPSGKFSDAKKSAQQWAKKHGHSTVYVMESVESIEEGKWNYPKDITGSKPDVYWDQGNTRKKEARKAHRKKIKAKAHAELIKGQKKTNEEVELDEISKKLAKSYLDKSAAEREANPIYSTRAKFRGRMIGGATADAKLKGRVQQPYKFGQAPKRKMYVKVGATNEETKLDEKLKASDDMGDWVKDFQDSDAPQFKGKSQKKRQQMAIAAKLDAEREAGMRNEEVELDELKRSTLASYVKKAAGVGDRNSLPNAMRDQMTAANIGDKEWYKDSQRKANKRGTGIQRAADRLAKEEVELDEVSTEKLRDYASAALQDKNKAKADKRWKYASKAMKTVGDREAKAAHARKYNKMEEVEQIDELKKSTLASYVKKASADQYFRGKNTQYHDTKAQQADGPFAKETKRKHYAKASDAERKATNRDTGIGRAVDRLTKEEVELDEAKNENQYIEVTNKFTGSKSHHEVHPSKAFAALNHHNSLWGTKSARIVSGKEAEKVKADLAARAKKRSTKVVESKDVAK